MLHRPGGAPRARNSSASHAGIPGARGSSSLRSEGALAIRQRIRAPLRLAWPPSRIKKAATPDRSEATASRRVAVKSSARGSPHNSPMTAERHEHLSPSSIAHSASFASRASTWMRSDAGNPGGWTRPLSRIAILSCTHSSGLWAPSCASRNPAQPPSRGCAANSSERVGFLPCVCRGGGPLEERWRGLRAPCKTPPSRLRRATSPANAGDGTSGRTEKAPPATSSRPLATRLTTFLFCFCSLSRDSPARVNGATRHLRLLRGTGRSRAPRRGFPGARLQSPCGSS